MIRDAWRRFKGLSKTVQYLTVGVVLLILIPLVGVAIAQQVNSLIVITATAGNPALLAPSGPTGTMGLGTSGIAFKQLLHGTCSVSAPTSAQQATVTAGQVPCTAANVTASDRVWVNPPSTLESGLVLVNATPAAGSITLNFQCLISSGACGTTAARTYTWYSLGQ